MTDIEKIAMLKRMTEELDEEVLSTYLLLAKDTVFQQAFPFGNRPDEFPTQYDSIHVEIAAYMLNRRGAEGEIVHLENGVSRHYEDGSIPSSLLRKIVPYAGVLQ